MKTRWFGIMTTLAGGLLVNTAQATVVYQDNFDNDGLAVNAAGLGGGAASIDLNGGASWLDNGNALYDNDGTEWQNASLLHSMNGFQSSDGFELTVNYYASSIASSGRNILSFGLLESASTYSGANNPFVQNSAGTTYGIGANVIFHSNSSQTRGLWFADGTGTQTLLDQSGTSQEFIAGANTPVVIRVSPDGSGGADWSYSINGVEEATNNIALFDFSKIYNFVAYGQDDTHTKRISSVSLNALGEVAPSADSQAVKVYPDTVLDITLTGTDPEGGELTYTLVDTPTNGALDVSSIPDVTYTPNAGYQGSDRFTFAVDNGALTSATATVSITVAPNDAPSADAQNLQTLPATAKNITLSGSDPDNGPSNLTYNVLSQPVNGALATNGVLPELTYTPNPGYEGSDSFTFLAYDGLSNSVAATITITVTNLLPTANAQSLEVFPDDTLDITLSGSDSDGPDSLTYTVDDSMLSGSLSGGSNLWTYTPSFGFEGVDHFTFTVNDGLADSEAATVSIAVTNQVPTAGPKAVATDFETDVAITLTGIDPEGNALTFSVVSQPSNGGLATNGALPDLTYTPNPGFEGTDSFAYTVNDGANDSEPGTVSITVLPDGTQVSFVNLNSSTSANTLQVGGSTNDITVAGFTNNLDYVYSVIYAGVDYDGDGANDTVTFDVRVKGWSGSTTASGTEVANTSSDAASAMIGTTSAAVSIASGARFSVGGNMANGETLEFMIENMVVSLTDATKVGSVVPAGFYSARLEEVSGHSHQSVFGEGTGLLGWDWNVSRESGTLSVGAGSLYVSSDASTGATSNPFGWGIDNVDFKIVVSVDSADVPDLSISSSGSDLVFSWEGGATYNVLTNADLVLGEWGVAVSGSSPMTNAVGSEAKLFFKLSE